MKTQVFFLILLILNFCFFSCNRNNDKEKKLTNGSIKYWNEYDQNFSHRIGAISFDKEHKCKSYVYNKKGELRLFYSDDIVYSVSTWSFVNDSTLLIEGFYKKILKLNNDTIVLQNAKTGDSTLLIALDGKIPHISR